MLAIFCFWKKLPCSSHDGCRWPKRTYISYFSNYAPSALSDTFRKKIPSLQMYPFPFELEWIHAQRRYLWKFYRPSQFISYRKGNICTLRSTLFSFKTTIFQKWLDVQKQTLNKNVFFIIQITEKVYQVEEVREPFPLVDTQNYLPTVESVKESNI